MHLCIPEITTASPELTTLSTAADVTVQYDTTVATTGAVLSTIAGDEGETTRYDVTTSPATTAATTEG